MAGPAALQDSLLAVAAKLELPTAQADSLNEWAWAMRQTDPQTGLALAQKALQICQTAQYLQGEIDSYKRLGVLYRYLGEADRALQAYFAALPLLKSKHDDSGIAIVCSNIGRVYLDQEDYALARTYFEHALQLNLDLGEPEKAIQQYQGIGVCHEEEQRYARAIDCYRMAGTLALEIDDSLELARSWNNLGGPFKQLGALDSAAYYYGKSKTVMMRLGEDNEVANILNNLGLLQQDLHRPQVAIDSFFRPALSLAYANGDAAQRQDILQNIALAHEQAGHADSALQYYKAFQALHDTLFNAEKSAAIAEAETRYQVAETEAENQLLLSEGRRKTVVMVAVAIIALLGIGIALLLVQFQRRRHRIQQELHLRRQQQDALRIVELIQDQELRALEALVEGQEQERNRLATEIHDGLGSLLATVKLYFTQVDLPSAAQQAAFGKADQLLDEACAEVRRYSHDLAGLPVAQFGLVNALRDLADSISGAGKLQVHLYVHNMENRLPLPVERSLYKAVQELLTNAIKHAQATQVTLQLSRHADHLNLILEDDGRGIDGAAQAQQLGMGLRNVRARIEALGGDFVLDSKPGHGTTALIDIPLKEEYHD
jgi:two-component system, NarL family, sensor kinase